MTMGRRSRCHGDSKHGPRTAAPAAHGPVLGMQTPRSHPRIRIFIFCQMPRLFTGTLKYENR